MSRCQEILGSNGTSCHKGDLQSRLVISGLASSSVKTCSKASACRAASAALVRTWHRAASDLGLGCLND